MLPNCSLINIQILSFSASSIANLLHIITVKEIYKPMDNSIQHSFVTTLCIMLQLPWNTINHPLSRISQFFERRGCKLIFVNHSKSVAKLFSNQDVTLRSNVMLLKTFRSDDDYTCWSLKVKFNPDFFPWFPISTLWHVH